MVYAMMDVETEHFNLWLSREIELTRRRVGQLEISGNSQTSKLTHVISEPIQQLLEKVIQKLDVSSDAIKHHSLAQTELLRFIVQLSPTIYGLVKRNSLSMNSYRIADEIIAQIRSDLKIALKIALLSIQNRKSDGAPLQISKPLAGGSTDHAPRSLKNQKIKRKSYKDDNVVAFLKTELAKLADTNHPPTIKDDTFAAQAAFPEIGREQIRRCRSKAYPESWQTRGPRKTIGELKSAG